MVPEHRICETNTNHGRGIATFPHICPSSDGMTLVCIMVAMARRLHTYLQAKAKMDKYTEMEDRY